MKVDWHELTLQEKKAGMYSRWIGGFNIHNEDAGKTGDASQIYTLRLQIVWRFVPYNNCDTHRFCRLS